MGFWFGCAVIRAVSVLINGLTDFRGCASLQTFRRTTDGLCGALSLSILAMCEMQAVLKHFSCFFDFCKPTVKTRGLWILRYLVTTCLDRFTLYRSCKRCVFPYWRCLRGCCWTWVDFLPNIGAAIQSMMSGKHSLVTNTAWDFPVDVRWFRLRLFLWATDCICYETTE